MPKEVPTVPGLGKAASQARATHRLGVPRAGPLWEQVVPTSSQSLWGGAGPPREGLAWLVVRALCLVSSSGHTHYSMPCPQPLPSPPIPAGSTPTTSHPVSYPESLIASGGPANAGTPGRVRTLSFVLCI